MPSTHVNPGTFAAPTVNSTTPTQVVPANLSRISLTVYNPGTIAIAVFGDDLLNPAFGLGGTITVQPGFGVQLDGWTRALLALSQSGTGNQITILEFS